MAAMSLPVITPPGWSVDDAHKVCKLLELRPLRLDSDPKSVSVNFHVLQNNRPYAVQSRVGRKRLEPKHIKPTSKRTDPD